MSFVTNSAKFKLYTVLNGLIFQHLRVMIVFALQYLVASLFNFSFYFVISCPFSTPECIVSTNNLVVFILYILKHLLVCLVAPAPVVAITVSIYQWLVFSFLDSFITRIYRKQTWNERASVPHSFVSSERFILFLFICTLLIVSL
jgi:hypothetical protein